LHKKKYPTRRTFNVQAQLEAKLGPEAFDRLVDQLGGREDSRPKRRPQRKRANQVRGGYSGSGDGRNVRIPAKHRSAA
jgi:hypothetical protein